MDYSYHVRTVPQSQIIPGKDMVRNNAGGYTFKVDKWQQLDRFLVMGSAKGSYYASEKSLTLENFAALDECIAENCMRVIDRAVEMSTSGRIRDNDTALFVLAKACADKKSPETRKHALSQMHNVARTGTHLFSFVKFSKLFGGWGRQFKRTIANWYQNKPLSQLIYQTIKYKQRDGWSHRDLMRLSHPKPKDVAHDLLYKKITSPNVQIEALDDLKVFTASETLATCEDPREAVKLIKAHNLPRECVNTALLKDRGVWGALLENMPMTAMLRNLGKMSSIGLIEQRTPESELIVKQLIDPVALKKSRVHPISILGALNVYQTGQGALGKLKWPVNRDIVDALNDSFYAAFDHIEPTHQRTLLALDVSGSMYGNPVLGIAGLNAATAAAAMSLVSLRVEKNAIVRGFTASSGTGFFRRNQGDMDGFIDLGISKRMLLDTVIEKMRQQSMGATDCALPMRWATKNQVPIDAFYIYTDNETWCGDVHPTTALATYRREMAIPAKLVVVAVCTNSFSIADESDPGMLDVAGFDSAAPQIISNFVTAKLDSLPKTYQD